MQLLNLAYPEKSQIKFEVSKFPDGQQNVTIQRSRPIKGVGKESDPLYIPDGELFWDTKQPVLIKSRLNNWTDLEFIVCTVASLRRLGVKQIHLFAPYILGARSDIQFVTGGNNYVKDVIAPIINSLNFESVTCMDPHSIALENTINNLKQVDNSELVIHALNSIYEPQYQANGTRFQIDQSFLNDKVIWIAPDAGASKKLYKLAAKVGFTGKIVLCSKDRDVDGKILRTVVPITVHDVDKDMILIDDICDGGRTFTEIGKRIKEIQSLSSVVHPSRYGNLYLVVTHGIFSKHYGELSKYFKAIYCTNSYQDTLKGSCYGCDTENIVNQINIF